MSTPGNVHLAGAGNLPTGIPAIGRSALAAFVLSVLVPGLGHIYVGRALHGVVLFALVTSAGVSTLVKFADAQPRFWPIALGALLWFVLLLLTAFEGALFARRAQGYALRRYNNWYVYLGAGAIGVAIQFAICAALHHHNPASLRSFEMRAVSMEPTILRGELVLAGIDHYRTNPPRRGDVAIYRHPNFTEYWIKRIVAVAGDRVMMLNGDAIVNGARLGEPHARVGDRASMYANTRAVVVPEGHVFVLGDNRANSIDSRDATHGFVPVDNLIGRATDILWSRNPTRFGRWIGTPR